MLFDKTATAVSLGAIGLPGYSMVSFILGITVVNTLFIGSGFLIGFTASVLFHWTKLGRFRCGRVLAGMVYILIAFLAFIVIRRTYNSSLQENSLICCQLIEKRFFSKWATPPDPDDNEQFVNYLTEYLNDCLYPTVTVCESVQEQRRTPFVKAVLNATKARIDAVDLDLKMQASGDVSLYPEVIRRYEHADKLDEEIPIE